MSKFDWLVKKARSAAWLAAVLAAHAQTSLAQDSTESAKPAETGVDLTPELAAVTAQLKAKFDTGETNAADLAESHQAIVALLIKHGRDGNREQVARLYLLDAHIDADGWHDFARANAIWTLVCQKFPRTVAAQGARLSLARLDAQMAAEPDPSIPEGLEVGQKFPGFAETDLAGNPLSVTGHRGRVTMIDFWATWCPPCRGEMPNVIATYNHFHAQGFDIIGVSLDSDHDALANFLQVQGMTWPQYFDGLAWQNKLAGKYAVHSIPMDYLLDTHGIIIGKELRGEALPAAVEKALADQR